MRDSVVQADKQSVPQHPMWFKSPCLAVLLAMCISAALSALHRLNLWPLSHTQLFSWFSISLADD